LNQKILKNEISLIKFNKGPADKTLLAVHKELG